MQYINKERNIQLSFHSFCAILPLNIVPKLFLKNNFYVQSAISFPFLSYHFLYHFKNILLKLLIKVKDFIEPHIFKVSFIVTFLLFKLELFSNLFCFPYFLPKIHFCTKKRFVFENFLRIFIRKGKYLSSCLHYFQFKSSRKSSES